jgi:predicted AlkP superfamily phosphohydrolase/phosphomutase
MPKLIVIGIDGMDPYVFEKIQSEMPHLSSISKSGGFKHCVSVFPPDSIPAWVTIFTGEYPEQHGWLDNIDYEDIRRGAQVNKLCDLQGKTFWDHLSQAGKRVCIINPLLAYPVWPVNGIMASGPVFITGEKQIFPRELNIHYELPEMGGMTDFPDESRLEQFVQDTIQSTNTLAHFGLELLGSEKWDLFFISFFTLDRMQHFLWRFWDDSDPLYPGHSNLEGSIMKAYKTFDEIVGKFLEQIDNDTGLVVLSDHGHGQRPTMLLNANELLRQSDFLKTYKDINRIISFKKSIELFKNMSIRVVVKFLGESWLYRIGRVIPKKTRKALKKSSYLIDKEESIAWASELGGGASVGGLTINPKINRLSQEYKNSANKILEILENVNSSTNEQVIKWAKIQDVENFYPDIVIELDQPYSIGRSLFCNILEKNPRHRIISGGHKKEGVLFTYNFGGSASKINSLHDISGEIISYVLSSHPD